MAIPTWFEVDVYLANKLAQLQAVEPRADWNEDSLTEAFEAAGYSGDEGAYQHFLDYGMAENLSPNAYFDVAYYLSAKAAQLNRTTFDGKDWTAALVMEAIRAAGMSSAWEHYSLFGSAEGIPTSANFATEAYVQAKTQLMNETAEGGRTDWTVAEVNQAFAAAGMNALEHYYLYGRSELEAAGKPTAYPSSGVTADDSYDVNADIETYSLARALELADAASLPSVYALEENLDISATPITLSQYAKLDALLSGASNGAELDKAALSYSLEDSVANIDGASATALAGAEEKYIRDSLVNVAVADDALISAMNGVTATLAFGATASSSATTTVKWADIDGKTISNGISLEAASAAAKGSAVIKIDASALSTAQTANSTGNTVTQIDSVFDFSKLHNDVTVDILGSKNADAITASEKGGTITGGNGADTITAGNGVDKIAYTAKTATSLRAEAGSVLGEDNALPDTAKVDTVTNFSGTDDKLVFSAALINKLTGSNYSAGDTVTNFAITVSSSSPTMTAGDAGRFYYVDNVLYYDAKGDSVTTDGAAFSGCADDFAVIKLEGVATFADEYVLLV